jgi:hypothetical protein
MEWSKAKLAREVERLRAITREHAERVADEPTSGGHMIDVAGDPFARGGVMLDARDAVLMDSMDVCLVDTKQDETPVMMLVIEGRVNYQLRRISQAYLFDADGAAAFCTQLAGLAARAGRRFASEFQEAFEQRMRDLP